MPLRRPQHYAKKILNVSQFIDGGVIFSKPNILKEENYVLIDIVVTYPFEVKGWILEK